MVTTPPLFEDDHEADETLGPRSAFLDDLPVAKQVRAIWELFHPYADAGFATSLRQAVRGLKENNTPCEACTEAYLRFQCCYWEMYVGCALLEQDVELVPRAKWDRVWKGAGPDLWAIIDRRNVWVECVAPGPGKGADAVPKHSREHVARQVPVPQINLRLLSAFSDKRAKRDEYVTKGIVKPEDGFVVAINARGVPLAFMQDDPPWIVRTLYGLGNSAVNYNLATNECSDEFLTLQPSVTKQNKEEIDANLFGNGNATAVSGVIYSVVDAWNPASSPSRGIFFVHNRTASVRLPDRWLPGSVSYSVKVEGNKGTIVKTEPEAGAIKRVESA